MLFICFSFALALVAPRPDPIYRPTTEVEWELQYSIVNSPSPVELNHLCQGTG